MKLFLLITVLILSITFQGCSSTKKRYVPKHTLKTFEQKRREAILAKYSYMRLHPELYIKKRRPVRRRVRVKRSAKVTPVRVNGKIKRRIVKQVSKPVSKPIWRDPLEVKKELEQNMIYYCFKHENDSRFSEPDDCTLFTKELLLECELKKIEDENVSLTRCLKIALRTR
jgi:hypothetical protein